jgi:hypothetical protein
LGFIIQQLTTTASQTWEDLYNRIIVKEVARVCKDIPELLAMINRTIYGVVSHTVIGVLMLVGGLIGLLREWLGAAATVLLLELQLLLSAAYIRLLPEVIDPT